MVLFPYRIVQAFESATIALVTQENFTNITVTTEDVALVGETVGVVIFSSTCVGSITDEVRNRCMGWVWLIISACVGIVTLTFLFVLI